MGSKSSSRYCFDQPSRGLKLAVLWLLLTVLGIGYARRRGITLTLLHNTRLNSVQCDASDASARLLKYRDVSTTLSQKRVRARAHGTDALKMLDQVTEHERSARNLVTKMFACRVVALSLHRDHSDSNPGAPVCLEL